MMKKSKCYLLGILALLCLVPAQVFAQNLTVEGIVIDESGEPLIGVSVVSMLTLKTQESLMRSWV